MTQAKHCMRIVKQPQERKQEILDGAMELFAAKGYEKTSMRDIANYVHISLGLCYRYFDSKQTLFQAAMDQYVCEIGRLYLPILHDEAIDWHEKLNRLYTHAQHEKTEMRYHDFFHRPEHLGFHEELGIKLCKYMLPHIREELHRYAKQRHVRIQHEEVLLSMITYGQLGIFTMKKAADAQTLSHIRSCIEWLIEKECIPDE